MAGPSGSTDPLYDKPFVDIDEWRDEPAHHRYVHGGFQDTDLRWSIHFPPAERYEGRFFQPLMAVSGTENAATMPPMMGAMIGHMIPFAFDSGAPLHPRAKPWARARGGELRAVGDKARSRPALNKRPFSLLGGEGDFEGWPGDPE